MKKLSYLLHFVTLIVFILLSGCKKDDPQPESERIQNLLTSGTWRVESVLVNETDQTTAFTGLTLSFSPTTYSTTNGNIVWPATGTWAFIDATAKKFLRDNELEVTLVEVTDETLRLSLVNPTNTIGIGRVRSVAGEHQFQFVKN